MTEVELRLSMPLHVFLSEAVVVARFFAQYWSPVVDEAGQVTRVGLVTAGEKLPADTGERILALQAEGQALHTAWILLVSPSHNAETRARAEFVWGEIVAVLDWFLDDGVEDAADAAFAKLAHVHTERGESNAALALSLEEYTALALPLRASLDGLIGFDARLLDEAPGLAAKLRAQPVVQRPSAEAEAVRIRRDVKLVALQDQVRLVRRAAQAVFRRSPDIIREATSAWERRGRAERARAARSVAPQS